MKPCPCCDLPCEVEPNGFIYCGRCDVAYDLRPRPTIHQPPLPRRRKDLE